MFVCKLTKPRPKEDTVFIRGILLASLAVFLGVADAKNVCAVVKIRIEQELTLERQAFDAALVIRNDLDTPLENVKVDVSFKDSEGNVVKGTSDASDTSAAFYIRLNDLNGIKNVDGRGVVNAKSKADIHWLIIPSPGAAGGNVDGKLYFVGATLSYRQAGQDKEVPIGADTITVRPTPKLNLDYFITKDVYGDNPLTKTVKEIPEPFKLGVLVSNSGIADANNVKIRSAQPEIIENKQDLLIDFKIIGSKVNNKPANTGLLVDMGKIPAGKVSSGYWIMKTSLAGTFKEISATVSHAENLGGQLTAIIKENAINTHLLAGHVLNNKPGKDGVYDFLADDGSVSQPKYRLYETDGEKVDVKDLSAKSNLTYLRREGNYLYYKLNVPKYDDLLFIDIVDPVAHRYPVTFAKSVSTNRRLPKGNVWTQFVRENGGTDNAAFVSHFRLFDIKSEGEYEIAFNLNSRKAQPPILLMDNFAKPVKAKAGKVVRFNVLAVDANGDDIGLEIKNLPKGATFKRVQSANGEVKYQFVWTPTKEGKYELIVEAFDGNEASTATITVDVSKGTNSGGGNNPMPKNFIFYDGFEEKIK